VPDIESKVKEAPLIKALESYAKLIEPWAVSVASYMIADVNQRNKKAWKEAGNEVGRSLRKEIEETPVGGVMRGLLAEQVALIKSLPLEAAERVHEAVQEEMPKGTRSTTIAARILEQQDVPVWKAKMIARTEVSRAAVTLTQARAEMIGSTGYIWRTVGDYDVRKTHQKMNGKFVPWSKPPKTDKSLPPYHAGSGPNCRCYPEPVFPDY
jgi:SPP1 gp7 family putative phage head morphogenesis protein